MPENIDTIAAIATPSGRGGIGVIRVSGNNCINIYKALTGKLPMPRQAQYVSFKASSGQTIDKGIALYFKAPSSYTGEDVVECHAHGSRVLLDMLLKEIFAIGARTARPGEFTERAFLNEKLDLIQAEAVADLIDSNSEKAARSAMQSLDGIFSDHINQLRDLVFNARTLLEAVLDFPEEEDVDVDFNPAIKNVEKSLSMLNLLLKKAEAGRVLDQNPSIVIAGLPNVGKSCLINYLSGFDSAIVSSAPGTTRDIIRESVLLDGFAVTLFDTAGIRETTNAIEKEGVERTYKTLGVADIVLYVIDNSQAQNEDGSLLSGRLSSGVKVITVRNKIDLYKEEVPADSESEVFVSVKTGVGMDRLVEKVCSVLDTADNEEDMIFARQRHIDALIQVKDHLHQTLLDVKNEVGVEVLAESLRQALSGFDEITGRTTSDDVLGNVFSTFCIGK